MYIHINVDIEIYKYIFILYSEGGSMDEYVKEIIKALWANGDIRCIAQYV